VAHEFDEYWPHPNSEDWGRGRVLVTTSSKEVTKKHDNNNLSQTYHCPKMLEDDAVNLLQKMCDIYERGAKEVVNAPHIDKNPLDIAWLVYTRISKSLNEEHSGSKLSVLS
jgi:hypothetical protein